MFRLINYASLAYSWGRIAKEGTNNVSHLEDVNTFITQSRACADADELRRLMEAITSAMGFTAYSLYQHVRQWDWHKSEALAISNYPAPWLERFFEQKFNRLDPVLLAAHRSALGFRWDQIDEIVTLNPKQRNMFETGKRQGIADGFTVPWHVPGEASGVCNFVVGPSKPLPERNLPMAELVGKFGYTAARQLWLKRLGIVRRGEQARLTPRQLDCLVLLARGKTDWEIAQVLGLKESTVNSYIDETKVALAVTRRSQLVSRALYEGHLLLSDTVQ